MVKKFVLVGLGSIGKRHLNNLEALGVPCRDIRIVRTRRGTASFGDRVLEEHGHRHQVFETVEEAVTGGVDVVLVTNPNNLHTKTALQAVTHGASVFIEKPFDASMDDVDELIQEIDRQGLMGYIAYNLRFHPLVLRIKEELTKGTIGDVISVTTRMIEPVQDWHPWEDHLFSYACRRDLGGGVILTQCHEIDLLHFFFGAPQQVSTIASTDPAIPEVWSLAETTLEFKGFVVDHLASYVGEKQRFLEICGTKGVLHWDFYDGALIITQGDKAETIREPRGFSLNDTFLEELRYFIQVIRGEEILTQNSLSEGKKVLKTLLAMETSALKGGQPVSIH